MAACKKCQWYSKEYDRLCQAWDDCIIEDEQPRQLKHYCINYDDGIPEDVFYRNAPCEWYNKKISPDVAC